MLIVEGTDLVGKSTFCNNLKEWLWKHEECVMCQHFGMLPPDWDYYYGYQPYIHDAVIMDRFHMSEVCYGLVCRGHVGISPETYRLVDADIRLVGGLTVVITASDALLELRFKPNEQFSLDQIKEVNALYRSISTRKCLTKNGSHWKMDVDMTFHLQMNHPFLTDEDVEHVATEWMERQAHYREIL